MAELYWIFVLLLFITAGFVARRAGVNLASCSGWVLLVMFHGLVIKPIFIFLELPNRTLLELTLLQKISFDEYWFGSLVMLLPYALFLMGMFLVGRYSSNKLPSMRNNMHAVIFSEKALCVIGLIALVGMVAFFIQFPQMLETANKNTLATDDLTEYSSGGIWRALAELSYLASMCALVNLGQQMHQKFNYRIFIALATLWLIFCLLSDQRGAMTFSVVTYLVAYGRWVRPVSRQVILLMGIVVVAFVIGKTALRLQGEGAEPGTDLAAIAANFIGQNFIENGKTISIIKAVPQTLDYQFGKTYLDSLLILVPRALYPDKTTVNLDTLIGNVVFDCGVFGACGVPAGLIGEAYLNFGLAGVPLIAILSGALVGWIDRRFRTPKIGRISDLFFVYSLLFFGMSILGSGYSSVITQLVMQALVMALVVFIAGKRLRRYDRCYISTALDVSTANPKIIR